MLNVLKNISKKMEIKTETEKTCRLCQKFLVNSSEWILIDDGVLDILTFVITQLDKSALQGASMCSTCLSKLHEIYNLKNLHLINFKEVKIKPFNITAEHEDKNIFTASCIKQESMSNPLIKEEPENHIQERENICYICKNDLDQTRNLPLFEVLEETKLTDVIGYILSESALETVEDPLICLECQSTLLDISDTLLSLSIYVNCNRALSNNSCSDDNLFNADIKEEFVDSKFVCKSEVKTELLEQMPCSSTEISDFEQFKIKNEEIDLKMELDQDNNEERWEQKKNNEISSFKFKNNNLICHTSIGKKSEAIKMHLLPDENTKEMEKLKNEIQGIYQCQICEYQTKYKRTLQFHMLIHKSAEERKKFQCQICSYQTINPRNLKRHILIHKNFEEIEMQKCQMCELRSKHNCGRRDQILIKKIPEQMEIQKNVIQETHSCQMCEYLTNSKTSFMHHMFIHKKLDEKGIQKCQICPFQTKHKNTFADHMLIHKNPDEIEMHVCQICKFETKYKRSLHAHMLIHKKPEEIKLEKCQICEFQTKYKRNLKIHMLIHKHPDEIEIQKCQICDYQTRIKSNLKTHSLRHKILMN